MVDAGPEAHMGPGPLALEVDLVGTFEHALVAVGRGIADIDQRPLRDGDAVHFHLLAGEAHQALHRRFQPHHFLDEGFHIFVGIAFQLFPDILVLDQQADARGQGVGGGLAAADERVRHHLGMQFIVVERPAPFLDHPVDQLAEQAVVGILAQPLENRVEIMLPLDFAVDHFQLGFLVQHHRYPLEKGIGPALDLPHVRARRAHLLANDIERQRHGKLADPVALAIVDKAVDQFIGQGLDQRVHGLDPARLERLVEHRPHLLVIGIIAARQGRFGKPALLLEPLLHELLAFGAAGLVERGELFGTAGKGFGIKEDTADILVAGDDIDIGARLLVDRCLVAQRPVGIIGALLRFHVQQIDIQIGLGCHVVSP